jgi:hypothetical protein
MPMDGQKAKLITSLDRDAADDAGIRSSFRIDLLLVKSPKMGVKCGTIAVWRNNTFDLDLGGALTGTKTLEALKDEVSNQTEVMYQDPIHFRESDGQWLPWALEQVMKIYDRVGGADVIVTAPRLKIRMEASSGKVSAGRSDLMKVFPKLKDIDRLLDANFSFDPWSRSVRKGLINAKKGVR